MTGISASARARTSSTRGPSILTASAPASLTKRMALLRPSAMEAVIAAEGHICDDQRATDGAADGAGVVEHLVHGDGEGVFMAEDDHGERVADEEQVDSSFVDQAGAGVVVGGERGDGLALALHFGERGHGDFCHGEGDGGGFPPVGKAGEAHGCLQCRSEDSGCGPNKDSIPLDGERRCRGGGAWAGFKMSAMSPVCTPGVPPLPPKSGLFG